MKRVLVTIAALVATASLAASAGVALAAHSAARAVTVGAAGSRLGRILVDGHGRTLYLFEKDRSGRPSTCASVCAAYWPPLLARGKPTAGRGARQALLGVRRRSNGTSQVTYAGHLAYRFAGDARAGETNGEGLTDFGAGWYVLTAAGKKIDRS